MYRQQRRGNRLWFGLATTILALCLAACTGSAPEAAAGGDAQAAEEAADTTTDSTSDAAAETESESETAPAPTSYSEPPMLDEEVEAGDLPPVEERLPSEPLVVEPFQSIGQYGGTLRMADAAQNMTLGWRVTQIGLFRYNQTASEVGVDLAQDYEFSEDLTTLTIHLREGHKWSDGEPFTVDDILFWWEDVQLNEELSPAGPPAFFRPGGESAEFTKIDDTTLEISFAVPYPAVLDRLGRTAFSGDPRFFVPEHYLQQWHIDYNPDAQALAEEEGFDSWGDAFLSHMQPPFEVEVGRPSVGPWVVVQEATDRLVFDRNPYFHMVDSEGNQLPYIDHFDLVNVGDPELVTLRATAGEVDFAAFFNGLNDMPVFRDNEEQGDYRTLLPPVLVSSELFLGFNQTTPDSVLRELFQTRDFRLALSLALNRERMNEAIFFGLGTPLPMVVLPGMSFFQEEWNTKNIEFDPDRTNELLDSVGLDERDDDGFRLRPDGERLSLLIEIGVLEGPKVEMCELVVADWSEVGVEATCQTLDSNLLNQRIESNEAVITTHHADRATLFGRANPNHFGWENPSTQRISPTWTRWLVTDGAEGEEPPQEIKDQAALFLDYQQALPGTAEFDELGAEYYDWFAEQVPYITTVGLQPRPLVVHNRLQNMPEEDIFWGSDTNFYQPYWPEQWYIQE